MSNLSNNRLNTTATAAQITAVKTALQTISTNHIFRDLNFLYLRPL